MYHHQYEPVGGVLLAPSRKAFTNRFGGSFRFAPGSSRYSEGILASKRPQLASTEESIISIPLLRVIISSSPLRFVEPIGVRHFAILPEKGLRRPQIGLLLIVDDEA